MRFAVLGAGAIGAYVGASLARAGSDVTLIARRAHLDAMQQRGVKVLSPLGDFEAHPQATDDFGALGDADVIFVALKANSLTDIAPRLAEVTSPTTVFVWAQNGIPWWYFQSLAGEWEGHVLQSVDPGGRISASLGSARNIGCVVYCSSEIASPGVIRHIEGTRFTLGEPDGEVTERGRVISDAFAAAGLKAPVDKRIRDQIWLKLIGNVAFNPISALTRATLGELGTSSEMRQLLRAVFEECTAVAEELGVRIPISLDRRLNAGLAITDHRTSMLQDLETGRPLELDCMTGAVLELAELVGTGTPHIEAIDACTRLLDQTNRRVVPPTGTEKADPGPATTIA